MNRGNRGNRQHVTRRKGLFPGNPASLVAFVSILISLVAGGCKGREYASAPRSFDKAPVILISIDTLRADHLPLFGYEKVSTPAIDALRKDSVLFTNAYSHVPLTLPSHVTVFTGLLPADNGVRSNIGYHFDAALHQTIPVFLKGHGYATGGAVSAYTLRSTTGLGAIFDSYDDAIANKPGAAVGSLQRSGEITAGVAESWIDSHQRAPLFYFLHLFEPHSPYEPPEPFKSRFSLPYDGEIAKADQITGDFLDHLKKTGLYDKAIIILMSDHGEGLYEHGEPEHGIFLYRESIHVPLMVKLPGNDRAGQTVTSPVGLVDIFPTVAQLLGLAPPAGLDGVSLFASTGKSAPPRRIYSETMYPRIHLGWSDLRSLIGDQFHFIEAPRPELYDFVADRDERTNVLDGQRRTYAAMKTELEKYPRNLQAATNVDPEEAAKLSALGYLGSTQAAPEGPLPDPKDKIGDIVEMMNAMRLLNDGHRQESIAAFRAIVKKSPRFTDAWNQLALTLETDGQYAEAAEAYRTAIRITPALAGEFGLSLGSVLLRMGKFDEAEAHANLSEKANPPGSHMLKARISLARRNLDDAERQARLAMEDQYSRTAARVLLAQILTQQGKLPEALRIAEETKEDTERRRLGPVEGLQFARGDILARMERFDEAISAFQDEIAHFPLNHQAYANLAVIYVVRGDLSAARATIEQMTKANPTRATYLFAAHTLDQFHDTEGAEAWRKRAAALR